MKSIALGNIPSILAQIAGIRNKFGYTEAGPFSTSGIYTLEIRGVHFEEVARIFTNEETVLCLGNLSYRVTFYSLTLRFETMVKHPT